MMPELDTTETLPETRRAEAPGECGRFLAEGKPDVSSGSTACPPAVDRDPRGRFARD